MSLLTAGGGGGSEVLVGVLSGIGTLVVAIVGYLGVRFAARQTRAAAIASVEAQRERDAAAVRVEGERVDLARIEALWRRVGELEAQVQTLTEREVAQHDALIRHVPWDYMVANHLRELIALLTKLGIDLPEHLHEQIPDAPPLTPPRE